MQNDITMRTHSLSLVIVCFAFGCATGTRAPKSQVTSTGQAIFNGYQVAEINCYECHGGDGRGVGIYPDLAKEVPELSDAEIIDAINHGPGAMPSFEDELDERQKQDLLAWLRDEFGGPKKAE